MLETLDGHVCTSIAQRENTLWLFIRCVQREAFLKRATVPGKTCWKRSQGLRACRPRGLIVLQTNVDEPGAAAVSTVLIAWSFAERPNNEMVPRILLSSCTQVWPPFTTQLTSDSTLPRLPVIYNHAFWRLHQLSEHRSRQYKWPPIKELYIYMYMYMCIKKIIYIYIYMYMYINRYIWMNKYTHTYVYIIINK